MSATTATPSPCRSGGTLGLALLIVATLAIPTAAHAGLIGKCRAACTARASIECDSNAEGSKTFKQCARRIARACRKTVKPVPRLERSSAIGAFCSQVDLRDEWRFNEDTLGGFSADVTVERQSGNAIGGTVGQFRWTGRITVAGWQGTTDTQEIEGCLTYAEFAVSGFSSVSPASFTVSFDCGSIAGEETYEGSMYRRFFE